MVGSRLDAGDWIMTCGLVPGARARSNVELSPELIGGLVLALTGLLSGFSTILNKRAKDQRDELDLLRKDYRHIREQLRLTDHWLYLMLRTLAQNGVDPPEPPRGLQMLGRASDDDDGTD